MDRDAHGQPDETEILKRARAFDQEALTWVYQDYHDGIYRYLYHHLGEVQTAQDLASDVFRRLLQALRNGGGPTSQLGAWLYRVAHNLIVDELRRRQHRNHESLDSVVGEFLRADTASLDEVAGRTIAKDRVRHALMALTEDQRQIIVLKFLEGMSNAEAAQITGKTVGAVKALQHRAIDALRDQLVTTQAPVLAQPIGQRIAVSASRT